MLHICHAATSTVLSEDSSPVFWLRSTACLWLKVNAERQFWIFSVSDTRCKYATTATNPTCVLVVQHGVPVAGGALLNK
jgi:hypothetical protein